jgi:hypothetical protein
MEQKFRCAGQRTRCRVVKISFLYFWESYAFSNASPIQPVSAVAGNVGDGPRIGEVNIFKKKGGGEMKNLKNAVLALAVMLSFAGCAANSNMVSKDTKIKCPKCGHTFTVGEGLRAIDAP